MSATRENCRRKLIEVALPLDAINDASRREVVPVFLDRSLRWISVTEREAPRWPGRDGGSHRSSRRG